MGHFERRLLKCSENVATTFGVLIERGFGFIPKLHLVIHASNFLMS